MAAQAARFNSRILSVWKHAGRVNLGVIRRGRGRLDPPTRPSLTAADSDLGNGCKADSTEFGWLETARDAASVCLQPSRIASGYEQMRLGWLCLELNGWGSRIVDRSTSA